MRYGKFYLFINVWRLKSQATSTDFILAVECTTYTSLTSGDPKTTYRTTKSRKCHDKLNGWYRFLGAAGTKMPASCPPVLRCGTVGSGWLNGGHPG